MNQRRWDGTERRALGAIRDLTLEDRARLRATHLRNIARFAEDGREVMLTPAQLRDAARLLDTLAGLSREGCDDEHPVEACP